MKTQGGMSDKAVFGGVDSIFVISIGRKACYRRYSMFLMFYKFDSISLGRSSFSATELV